MSKPNVWTVECNRCDGGGKERTFEYIIDPDGDYTCHRCNGLGKTKKGGYGQYKSQAQADRHGETCDMCQGNGVVRREERWTKDCYSCSGRGWKLAEYVDVLPESIKRVETATEEFMRDWLARAQVLVVRQDREATWNEAHLGVGTAWSAIDYGEAWKNEDEWVARKVVNDLDPDGDNRGLQFAKFVDPDTREVSTTVIINVTRGGYTVRFGDVDYPAGYLPPTYTAEVLNRPWTGRV